MSTDSISEPTFLLTELRYTLGQLNAQLGDLSNQQEAAAPGGASSIDDILTEMEQAERKYQEQYSRMTGVGVPEQVPVQDTGSPAATFERMRIGTIAMLEQADPSWPADLLEAVRQQVADDRQRTTRIADDRRQVAEGNRADLNEPLTGQTEPNKPHTLQ